MNTFQWIAISGLAIVLMWDLRALFRQAGHTALRLVRIALWILAITCVYQPNLTSLAARQVGIDRGADFVAYAFHFAFLASTLYFYARYLQMRTTLTEVVRYLAIRDATQKHAASEAMD
jgi:hypothetical protein